MVNKVLVVLFLVFSLSFVQCSESGSSLLQSDSQLIVALDTDMPGYFTLNGQTYGYQYEILRAYARAKGMELQLVSNRTPRSYERFMRKKHVDFVVLPKEHVAFDHQECSVDIYTTTYVVLGRKGDAGKADSRGDLRALFAGGKVSVSNAFTATKAYDYVMDSIENVRYYISSLGSFDLIEDLCDKKYDYLICEKSEALLGCALVKSIQTAYEFEEPVQMSIVVNPQEDELLQNFTTWWQEFSQSEDNALLSRLYFQTGIANQIILRALHDKKGATISAYDELVRRVSEREGYDWRMISAIIYHESKFNPYIVSRQGAKGLMQIMPAMARQFQVEYDEIMDPELNISLGIKLLCKIEKALKFGNGVSFRDRMSIILASYNAGIGHVLDARRLAVKYGQNPDSWEMVSTFLRKKSEPEVWQDEVVKCGRFNGTQTHAFVNNVMSKYQVYCARVGR